MNVWIYGEVFWAGLNTLPYGRKAIGVHRGGNREYVHTNIPPRFWFFGNPRSLTLNRNPVIIPLQIMRIRDFTILSFLLLWFPGSVLGLTKQIAAEHQPEDPGCSGQIWDKSHRFCDR
jgi:hypothetical protein